jgi:hypothetical protein
MAPSKAIRDRIEVKMEMKRLALLVGGLLLVIPMLAAGCTPAAVSPEKEMGSSCNSCHSDKDLVKQTATQVKEEKSEASSGEG